MFQLGKNRMSLSDISAISMTTVNDTNMDTINMSTRFEDLDSLDKLDLVNYSRAAEFVDGFQVGLRGVLVLFFSCPQLLLLFTGVKVFRPVTDFRL